MRKARQCQLSRATASADGVCAGLVCSTIGHTATYLLGATGDRGMQSNGAYLLHWRLIEQLKKNGPAVYDLYGVNPEKNPGTYRFKKDLAGHHGREVVFLGQFEACASAWSQRCVDFAGRLRVLSRRLRDRAKSRPKP